VELSQDFTDLLVVFEKAGARYLLIGGYAVVAHTKPRYTKDIDLWVGPAADSIERVVQALSEFGAPARAISDIRTGAADEIVWFGAPPGRVDILKQIPGVVFETAYERRVRVTLGGILVSVLSVVDLIASKRAAGRPQDLLDVEALLTAQAAENDPEPGN